MTRLISAVLLFAMAAQAQRGGSMSTMRADIRGGGGDHGKCTIEVEVDGVAEVEIREQAGRLRTLSGQPANWRRFECNAPMPRNPAEFRFRGIDGRGRQELVSDPGRNGVAVVRIEDSKGGREGYTFDLEWRGGSNLSGGGGGGWGQNSGWNDEVDFRGNGDGYFRTSRGAEERLKDCRVNISRRGEVEVSFETNKSYRLNLLGRLTRIEGDHVGQRHRGSDGDHHERPAPGA